MKAHTQAIVTLKATLVTASDQLRAKLQPLSDYKLMTTCVGLDSNGDPADPAVTMRHVLCSLARRWFDLHEEIKAHTKRLKKLTTATAPRLVDAFGIGPDIAGELLVAAGDNTNRIRSEAAFAKLCGVCPIPAGSGKTSGRLRLNRGGNRQANAALYRAVIVRMRWHIPNHLLCEAPHRRRPLQEGNHPLPQALPGSRRLQPPPTSTRHRRISLPRLRSIGASVPPRDRRPAVFGRLLSGRDVQAGKNQLKLTVMMQWCCSGRPDR